MRSDIYERICALLSKLGWTFDEYSEETATAKAFATAISIIYDDADTAYKETVSSTASKTGLILAAELTKTSTNLNVREVRKRIRARMSEQYGDYTHGEFESEIKSISDKLSFDYDGFEIVISGYDLNDYDNLAKIGDVIYKYISPLNTIRFDKEGCDFDYWDNSPYLFKDFDNLNMTFNLLSTI